MKQEPNGNRRCGVVCNRREPSMTTTARIAIALVFPILGACAPFQKSDAEVMRDFQQKRAAEEAKVAKDRNLDARNNAQAIVEQSKAGKAAQVEAMTAAHKAQSDAEAARKQAVEDEKKRKEEEVARVLEQECAASRPLRLTYLKQTITEYHAEIKELKPYSTWIEAHCKYEDTRGVLVQRERTKDGVVVRTKQVGEEDAQTCDAPKPLGVTHERVKRTLWLNSREDSDPLGLNYASNRNLFGQENSRCATADRAAGLDLYVLMNDFEGQKAMLAR